MRKPQAHGSAPRTCFGCGSPFTAGDRFCSNCGRGFIKKEKPSVSHGQNALTQAPDGRTAYNLMVRKKRIALLKLVSATFALTVTCWFIGCNFDFWSWGIDKTDRVIGFSAAGGVVLYLVLSPIRAADYYRIEGSTDSHGNHRCIFCGGRGVYKQGEYKTNNTHHNCSRCGSYFFSS